MARNNCSDCVYRVKVGGDFCCDYLFKTGTRRPCPPGDECTVKVGMLTKRKKAKGN